MAGEKTRPGTPGPGVPGAGMGLTVGPAPSRRRPVVAVAALLAVAVAAAGFALGRHHTTDSDSGGGAPAPVVTWASDGPWPVPRSATEGPTRLSAGSGGVPVGYAHDALGAALAAFNITEQLTSDVGPVVAAVTARTQTFGDPTATLAMVQSSPTGGVTPATELLYTIVSGDPGGDRVVVAIAARSPDSSARGGVSVSDREMRWIDGDWRMGLPMSAPVIVPALQLRGFTSLGGPHV